MWSSIGLATMAAYEYPRVQTRLQLIVLKTIWTASRLRSDAWDSLQTRLYISLCNRWEYQLGTLCHLWHNSKDLLYILVLVEYLPSGDTVRAKPNPHQSEIRKKGDGLIECSPSFLKTFLPSHSSMDTTSCILLSWLWSSQISWIDLKNQRSKS